jgi:DNA helicase IV
MAMLRASYLASPLRDGGGPVLLVTYNNALVTYLRHLVPGAVDNVTVETYGKFARGYLNSIGKMPRWGGITPPAQRRQLVAGAVTAVAATYRPSRFFKRDTAFFLDELEWISGMGITSLAEYKTAQRVGRRVGLVEAQRAAIWKILETYRAMRQSQGVLYDWYDIASAVRRGLAMDARTRIYQHVVIDEGQDLAPEAIRSLVEAVPSNGTVTFFGDYHQQIYGQGLSWRSCGLKINAVDRFEDNLRNTAEIARVAIAMSRMSHMIDDSEDLVVPVEPLAAGATPTLAYCANPAAEIAQVQRVAAEQSRGGTVAVLARTWEDARRACGRLKVRKLDPKMVEWDPTPGIYCGAYHSAKGLEFDVVIMPFCDTAHVPHSDVVEAFGRDEAARREGKLLYVAATRAKAELLVTYSGELSPLIPRDTTLWTRVSV